MKVDYILPLNSEERELLLHALDEVRDYWDAVKMDTAIGTKIERRRLEKNLAAADLIETRIEKLVKL